MPVWALVTLDLMAVLLVVGGWFGARIVGDHFAKEEPYLVSEAGEDLMEEIETPLPAQEPAEEEEPAEDSTENAAEEPAEDTAEDTAEDAAEEPAEGPAENAAEEPAEDAAPEDSAAMESEKDNRTEWQIRFEDHFTPEVVCTENSYTSPNVSVTITHHEVGKGDKKITYHLADIYIGNVECFRSALAKTPPRFRMSLSLLKMMEKNNAIVAVNGDFMGYSYGGFAVRNGVVWSSRSSGVDMCVLFRDGRMKTYTSGKFRLTKAAAKDVFQLWSFGPALLNEDGTPRNIPWSSIPNKHISGRNPRTAIGYYEPGHYCFMVVDGRQKGYSRGATLGEMSRWFSKLGCVTAFNLDGGGSSLMGFQGKLISKFYSQYPRNLSDCIYIADYAPPEESREDAPAETEDQPAETEAPGETREAEDENK